MTAPALSQPSRHLRDTLETWCAIGVTGALRVLDPPGGTVFLTAGRISYAECPAACGVDRLLTASGRLSADAWRAALAAGRASRRVGETLVHQGLLTPVELKSTVLSALYGAALFLFDLDTAVRLEMGAGHVIGPVVEIDLRIACAEVDRRRRALADAWSDSKVDNHAVVPARRLSGHHVALNALQWEIVANADRRRTPVDLARSLGRDTFATLLEVRRMARTGLVEPGRPSTGRAADGWTGRRGDDPATGAPAAGEESGGVGGDGPDPDPDPCQRSPQEDDGAPLPRRRPPTAQPPAAPPAAQTDGPPPDACPESTLIRIRDALLALR